MFHGVLTTRNEFKLDDPSIRMTLPFFHRAKLLRLERFIFASQLAFALNIVIYNTFFITCYYLLFKESLVYYDASNNNVFQKTEFTYQLFCTIFFLILVTWFLVTFYDMSSFILEVYLIFMKITVNLINF